MVRIMMLVLVVAAVAWGGQPLGTVSCSGTLVINGAAVPAAGVPSWPLKAGDVVGARGGAATITFADGSRVVIDDQGKVQVDGS